MDRPRFELGISTLSAWRSNLAKLPVRAYEFLLSGNFFIGKYYRPLVGFSEDMEPVFNIVEAVF